MYEHCRHTFDEAEHLNLRFTLASAKKLNYLIRRLTSRRLIHTLGCGYDFFLNGSEKPTLMRTYDMRVTVLKILVSTLPQVYLHHRYVRTFQKQRRNEQYHMSKDGNKIGNLYLGRH